MTVVDLFAGMGGWDIAARQLGVDPLGVEWMSEACATRQAAGLRTHQADIATLDPADFAPVDGLIASPPCQDFSVAGKDGPVAPPAPTHQEYRHGVPARREVGLFGALEPWVSMAEALGWNDGMALRQWRGEGMVERYGSRPDREASEPSFAVTGADHRTKLVVDRRTNSRGPEGTVVPTAFRPCDTPAPTVDTQAGSRWVLRAGNERPHGRNNDAMTGRSENAIRLTEAEGLTLQGFPPDWPVQGTKTTRWTQIGNAVPPPLARAVLAQVIPTQEAAA